jgi:hypothetical protein
MSATVKVQMSAAGPIRPVVRVVPVPRLEPPSDEELLAAGIEAPPFDAPLLPLDLPGYPGRRTARRIQVQASPGHAGQPHAIHIRPTARDDESTGMSPLESWAGAGHESVERPSPCRAAMTRFLAVVFEVAGGFRPVAQLRGLCRPDRFDDICGQITGRHPTNASRLLRSGGFVPPGAIVRGRRTPAVLGRTPTSAPPRAGRVDSRGPAAKITVKRMHICDVSDQAAEVSVVLARSSLIWAVAARMELVNGRWLCAHLEIL